MTHMQKLLAENLELRHRVHTEATAVAVAYGLPIPPTPQLETPPAEWQQAVDAQEQRTGIRIWKWFSPALAWGQS